MSLRVQRLIALALAGWLLFDFPLLALWSSNATLVFAWWGLLIVLVAVVVEGRGTSRDDDHDGDGDGDGNGEPARADAARNDGVSA